MKLIDLMRRRFVSAITGFTPFGPAGAALAFAQPTAKSTLPGVDQTRAVVGISHPRTTAEIAASVEPVHLEYSTEPYDIRRYGALSNNLDDDTPALRSALNVATQIVAGARGGAITVPTGISHLSSMVELPNRVRVLGTNKRGSYFLARKSWTSGAGEWLPGKSYASGDFVSQNDALFVAKQTSRGRSPADSNYWHQISNAIFYANNGFVSGAGVSMFDSTLENLSIDADNKVGLGCVLSSAWQEDCGLRGALLINFGSHGLHLQDGFGGASLTKVVDCEIFGGSVQLPISRITQSTSAKITVSTPDRESPFWVGSVLAFNGVRGMSQINGLTGRILSVDRNANAWTATVSIDSSGFNAFDGGGQAQVMVGIQCDKISLVGAFMLDVSNTSIVGGAASLAAGINMANESLNARNVHFENANAGIYLSGFGHTVLIGISGNPTVRNLVEIDASWTGTLTMIGCFRNGSQYFLVDHRPNGIGSIAGYDMSSFHLDCSHDGPANYLPPVAPGANWSGGCFDGTLQGTHPPAAGFNVASVQRLEIGTYLVTEARARAAVFCAPWAFSNVAGANCTTELRSTATYAIKCYVAGELSDSGEIKFGNMRLQ